MLGSEERAGHRSGISASPEEGVAPYFDSVAEIAVPPRRPRADGAGRGALGPVFQSGEVQVAVEGIKVDGEVGDPGDSLRRGGKPE